LEIKKQIMAKLTFMGKMLGEPYQSDKGDKKVYTQFADTDTGGQCKLTSKTKFPGLQDNDNVMVDIVVRPGFAKGGGVFLEVISGSIKRISDLKGDEKAQKL